MGRPIPIDDAPDSWTPPGLAISPDDAPDSWTPPEPSSQAKARRMATGQEVMANMRRDAPALLRQGGLTLRHGAEGVADILGLVVDPVSGLVNAALPDKSPKIGSLKSIAKRIADAAGLPSPESDTERMVGKAVSGVVGAATPVGMARTVAVRSINPVTRNVAGQVAAQPGAQMVGGGLAGGAGEAVRQEGGNEYEQAASSVAAGFAPSLAVGGVQALRAALGGDTWMAGLDGQKRLAAQKLEQMVGSGDLDAELAVAVAKRDILPGSKPTTAQALSGVSGRTQPLAAERSAAAADPVLNDMLMGREAERQGVRRSALENLAPGNPQALQDSVQSRVARLQALAAASQQRAAGRAQEGVESLGAPLPADVAGDVIRKGDTAAYGTVKQQTSGLYQRPELQSMKVTIPADKINAVFDDVYQLGAEQAVPEMKFLVGKVNEFAESGETSFAIHNAIRSGFSDIAHKASRDGDAQTARAATMMLKEMDASTPSLKSRVQTPEGLPGQVADDVVDEAAAARIQAMTPVQRQQATILDMARASRADQGKRFESGPAAAMRATGADNVPQLQGAEIPRKFLHNGPSSREDAAAFISAYRDKPEAIEAGRRYLIGQMRDYATDANGVIAAKKLDKWVNEYQPALKVFEGSMPLKIRDIATAQKLSDSLGERAVRLQEEIDKSAMGLLLKTDDPQKAISKAMNSTSPSVDLRRLAHNVRKDPDAVRGLKRGMIDHLMGKSAQYAAKSPGQDGPTLGQASLSREFAKNYGKLKQVFSPDELRTIKAVVDDAEQAALSANAGRGAGSDTEQKRNYAQHLGLLLSGRNTAGLLGAVGNFRAWILEKPQEEIQAIFREALLDPVAARDLLKAANASSERMILPKLQQIALRLGQGATSSAITTEE